MEPKHKKPPVRESPYAKQAEKRSSQHASGSNHSDQALPSKQLFSVDDPLDMDTDGPPTDDQANVLDMFARLNLSSDSESDDFLEAACMGPRQPEFPVPNSDFVFSSDSEIGAKEEDVQLPQPSQVAHHVTTTISAPTDGKGSSIAHELIIQEKVVLVSFDIETGGEDCGICQISAVAFDLHGNSLCNDFDYYVKPPPGAKWDNHHTNVHGLHANHDCIKSADMVEIVWP